ncbi:MAG: hypothetical protein FJW20_07810 [Acidimicrobiia bacterium]|nr:hypothetical protein [Acidimicrobiia bacterium]
MTTHDQAADLIERYLHQVGENLPNRQREDVCRELRTLIEDSVRDRTEAGDVRGATLAADVLHGFGPPEQVAARYAGERYLIGPGLYPYFIVISQVIVIGLVALFGVFLAIHLFRESPRMFSSEMFEILWGWSGSLVKFVFINLGLLVAVLAAVERLQSGKPDTRDDWDPLKLPEVPKQKDLDRISNGSVVFEGYLILALFLLVNFATDWFGVIWFQKGELRSSHFTDFGLYLPLVMLNIWWGLAMALKIALLRVGRWNRELRWAEFALGLFGAFILYQVIEGSSGYLLTMIAKLILLATGIEAAVRFYRLCTRYAYW